MGGSALNLMLAIIIISGQDIPGTDLLGMVSMDVMIRIGYSGQAGSFRPVLSAQEALICD